MHDEEEEGEEDEGVRSQPSGRPVRKVSWKSSSMEMYGANMSRSSTSSVSSGSGETAGADKDGDEDGDDEGGGVMMLKMGASSCRSSGVHRSWGQSGSESDPQGLANDSATKSVGGVTSSLS